MTENRTDLLKARIRTLWTEGVSAGQISARVSAEFGERKSRSAVIGLVRRMGLQGLGGMKRSTRDARTINGLLAETSAPKARKRAAPPAVVDKPTALEVVKVVPAAVPIVPAAHGGVLLIGLPMALCRWPVAGGGEDLLVCGGSVKDGKPYCSHHCRLAYQPAEKRRAA